MDNKTLLTKILTIGIIFLFFNISASAVLTDTKTPIINKSDKECIDKIVAKTPTGKSELKIMRSKFGVTPDFVHQVSYFGMTGYIKNIGTDVFYGNVSYYVEISPLTNPSKILVEQDYSGFLFLEPLHKKTFFKESWDSKLFHDGDKGIHHYFIFRSKIYGIEGNDTILWNQATEIGILVATFGFSVFIFYI